VGIPSRLDVWSDIVRNFSEPGFYGIGGSTDPWGQRNIDAELAKIKSTDFRFPPASEGFTTKFEYDDSILQPIELDDLGIPVPRKVKLRPYLACSKCGDHLLLSQAQKTSEQRIWALRCGHLVDQKCLKSLSTPTPAQNESILSHPPEGLNVLGIEDGPRSKRPRRSGRHHRRTAPPPPKEFTWSCPVKGCGRAHVSFLVETGWDQKEDEGALQVYV